MACDCSVHLRNEPVQYKELVRIGCGAGFAGDRPIAALKLLMRVPNMDYLVLECLAERTLAIRHEALVAGGKGYNPRISEWMQLLLPEAVKRDVCIITNMGASKFLGPPETASLHQAFFQNTNFSSCPSFLFPSFTVDAEGAQEEVLNVAKQCQLHISVGVVREVFADSGGRSGSSTYLGAAPIVKLLETSKPNVIITTRLADASLFLGPMVYELGWNWNEYEKLAQGTLAGHLLECGCQVTGGYFAHPADEYRDLSLQELINVSLPYAEISDVGGVVIAKPKYTGGELSVATCGQQLLYEIGDPSSYITPDVVVDFTYVTFNALSEHQVLAKGAMPAFLLRPEKLLRLIPQDCGWKAWGEISYGGVDCIQRAETAKLMVLAWMEEMFPESSKSVVGYLIGVDSLLISPIGSSKSRETLDIRLRMDGLFDSKEQAIGFTREFEALYTNGPAGGGGISVGCRKEVLLNKVLVPREETFWKMNAKVADFTVKASVGAVEGCESKVIKEGCEPRVPFLELSEGMQVSLSSSGDTSCMFKAASPAPAGVELPLYKVVHCRTGDKGNDVNFSLIPHCTADLPRLQSIVTIDWIKRVTRNLFFLQPNAHYYPGSLPLDSKKSEIDEAERCDDDVCVEIYVAQGIHALNIVVRKALDGGVTCSRRIDRHGKSLSDLILCQIVTLPEIST